MTSRDFDFRSARSPRSHKRTSRSSGTDVNLIQTAQHLDGRPYGYYGDLRGDWDYGDFTVHIERIQADPYAPPSLIRVSADPKKMGLPEWAMSTGDQRLAASDYLHRAFAKEIAESPALRVAETSQEILARSAVSIRPERVEIRFNLQLPARGRSIMGREAARLLDVDVPEAIMATLDCISDDSADYVEGMRRHVYAYEDFRALQNALVDNDWVAFVADGSVLARRSGISQKPMPDSVPFSSPDSMRADVKLPHAGTVSGMAIRPGVSVIIGGGYHGKSTLVNALSRGVYAHIPGDGRELVATLPNAMKVKACDGRAVTAVDVSAFITHLPSGADTRRFSTENASGSTSQAAAIVEAIEAGSRLLLIDEDTSATNLLIRDQRMRTLVAAAKEPITPLIDRIRAMYEELGVSTILVMGGSGDYLDVADTVVMLDEYRAVDVTERAREVVAAQPRERQDILDFPVIVGRVPVRRRRVERPKTKVVGRGLFQLDKATVDISDVEQVVDPGQVEAIAWLVRGVIEELANARVPMREVLATLDRRLNSETLDTVVKFGAREYPAQLTRPRMVDVAAALNRFRGLIID